MSTPTPTSLLFVEKIIYKILLFEVKDMTLEMMKEVLETRVKMARAEKNPTELSFLESLLKIVISQIAEEKGESHP